MYKSKRSDTDSYRRRLSTCTLGLDFTAYPLVVVERNAWQQQDHAYPYKQLNTFCLARVSYRSAATVVLKGKCLVNHEFSYVVMEGNSFTFLSVDKRTLANWEHEEAWSTLFHLNYVCSQTSCHDSE